MIAVILLGIALLPLLQLVVGRRRPAPPGPRFPRMTRAHWLRFGAPPLVLLGLTGQWAAFWRMPAPFAPAAVWLGVHDFDVIDRWYLIGAAAIGIAVGIGGGVLLSAWRAWRGRPEGTLFGDAGAVRPRGSHEFGWAAALAITAGITEEWYFRLLLPLLATQAGVPAVAAFAGAALLFGLAHRYQGWRGMLATSFAGVALTVAYLATTSVWAAIVFHAVGDLGHLVLRPAVRGGVERWRLARVTRLG